MKVFFDHQVFSYQDFGGISVVFSELAKQLIAHSDVQVSQGAILSGNINYLDIYPSRFNTLWRQVPMNIRMKVQKRVNQLNTWAQLKTHSFDIVHPTYYEPEIFNMVPSKTPTVIHVHDTIQELFDTEKGTAILEQKKESIARATKIIAISENTKQDVVRIYGTDPDKITVINLAADGIMDPAHYDETGLANKLPKKYILFDGNHTFSYKNFLPLLRAVAPLMQKSRDLFFICNGGREFSPEELSVFKELTIEKQMISINIGNGHKMQGILFARATVFAYPSKYEGFGIPLIQSMLWNVPVACSNSSCFPEICLDAPFYFDPNSTESMYNAVEEALNNQVARKRHIELGAKRAKDFSWARNAQQTLDLYQSLL